MTAWQVVCWQRGVAFYGPVEIDQANAMESAKVWRELGLSARVVEA